MDIPRIRRCQEETDPPDPDWSGGAAAIPRDYDWAVALEAGGAGDRPVDGLDRRGEARSDRAGGAGLGTLVPEETMLIPATTDGRVQRILIYPGTPVKADSVS